MIKLNPAPTFEHDVRLTVPGRSEPVVVPMTLAYMHATQRVAWFEANKDKPLRDSIAEVVLGWGVRDGQPAPAVQAEDGSEVAFSAQALAALVTNYDAAAAEILRDWQLGLTESRVKN